MLFQYENIGWISVFDKNCFWNDVNLFLQFFKTFALKHKKPAIVEST